MRTMWQAILVGVLAVAFTGQLRAENQQVQIDIQVLDVLPEMLTKIGLAADSERASHLLYKEISEVEKLDWIRTLRADGCGKLLAEPRLVTFSGRPARFLAGGQQAIPGPKDANGAPTMLFQDVGTSLEILPTVKADGTVYLEVQTRLSETCEDLGIQTAAGFVPGFSSNSWKAALQLKSGTTFVMSPGAQPMATKPHNCPVIFLTPHIITSAQVVPASVHEPANDQAARLASVLASEYRQACAARDKELAAKLGRMALEFDPFCLGQAVAPCPMPALPVQALPAPMPATSPAKPPLSLDTPIEAPIQRGEPLPTCQNPPIEKEVLEALNASSAHKLRVDDVGDEIEIVCEKLVDKIEEPRFYPLVGPAQLHHCHWKCTVYITEAADTSHPYPLTVKKRHAEVVYIDKDFLHLYVPEAKPAAEPVKAEEQTKKQSFRERVRSFFKLNWDAGTTLPSGFYLEHAPQYFQPNPMLEMELATMQEENAEKEAPKPEK